MRYLECGAKLLRRLARLCAQCAVRLSDTDEGRADENEIAREPDEGDAREICMHAPW